MTEFIEASYRVCNVLGAMDDLLSVNDKGVIFYHLHHVMVEKGTKKVWCSYECYAIDYDTEKMTQFVHSYDAGVERIDDLHVEPMKIDGSIFDMFSIRVNQAQLLQSNLNPTLSIRVDDNDITKDDKIFRYWRDWKDGKEHR